MTGMNPGVDFYFDKTNKWQSAILQLRTIVLNYRTPGQEIGLTETLKWGCPCYTFEEKNIVLIHVFKEYCALLFFKGALLEDVDKILIQQTENVQAARQIRFVNVDQITKMKAILKTYISQAIKVEKLGLKVELKKTAAFKIPAEFQQNLDNNPALQTAFYKLTAGRQRAYLLHFSQPKQAQTRVSRIEKCIDQMIAGKGLND